ncbi:solute carrier family 28 member 3-like [Amblyomma americanum]
MISSEAPLLIRPYVQRLTLSEMHCIMTVGFASVSAAMLPVYSDLGLDSVDVMVASLLSTIAGIVSSKLLQPETELTALAYCSVKEQDSLEKRDPVTLQDSMTTVVAVVEAVAVSLAAIVGHRTGKILYLGVKNKALLTPLLEPLVLLMGVNAAEAHAGARLLATGLLANEVVAYRQLTGPALSASLSVRTRRVFTYALCGFTNVGSLCITLGVLSALAPSRSEDVVSLLLRALVAGAVANALTACAVGKPLSTFE